MSKRRNDVNKLMIEGKHDLFVVAYLLDHFIVWGDRPDECVGGHCRYDGVEQLLAPDEIETVLLAPGLERLAIIVDANGNCSGRWQAVRRRCIATFPNLPFDLPPEGLIAVNDAGLRLGVWIMPDNRNSGMLETLLQGLAPTSQNKLVALARASLDEARRLGSTVTDAHLDKAALHTWLAWQEPPGLQLHQAIIARTLNLDSPLAAAFSKWFIDLFELEDLRRS